MLRFELCGKIYISMLKTIVHWLVMASVSNHGSYVTMTALIDTFLESA